MSRLFSVFCCVVLFAISAGCARDPAPEKIRFFLESTLDAHNKVTREKTWEIAEIKTTAGEHPAGRMIKFEMVMRATKNLYRSIYKRDELPKHGWKSLDEMIRSDDRFGVFQDWVLANARSRETDYRGDRDIFEMLLKQGETRVIHGQVLTNKASGDWQFTKLEFSNINELDIAGVDSIPKEAPMMGTDEANVEFTSILSMQKDTLDRIFSRAKSAMQESAESAQKAENEAQRRAVCEKRCAGTSLECVFNCEKELGYRSTQNR